MAKKKEYPNGLKTCTKCKEEKLLEEFYYHRVRKYYMSSCKSCNKKASTKYQKETNYRESENYVFYQRAYKIKYDAKFRGDSVGANGRNGLEVMENLKDYLISLWKKQDGKCYYTGLEMSLTGYSDGNQKAFTVDRIDSSKGYIDGNIALCCSIVNKMKQNLSLNELYDWCELIQKNIKKLLVD